MLALAYFYYYLVMLLVASGFIKYKMGIPACNLSLIVVHLTIHFLHRNNLITNLLFDFFLLFFKVNILKCVLNFII